MTKSIIMAGGPGTRLFPFTDTRPKPNVYVGGNKRMLEYVADRLVEAGFFDIFMAVQYRSGDIIRYFGDGSDFDYDGEPLNIVYTYGLDEDLSGTADSIRKSRLWLSDSVTVKHRRTGDIHTYTGEEKQAFLSDILNKKPDDPKDQEKWRHYEFLSYDEGFKNLIVSSGDAITNFNYEKMLEFHSREGAFATVALMKVPLAKLRQYGAVSVPDGRNIGTFHEKKDPKALPDDIQKNPLANLGIYVFDSKIFGMLEKMGHVLDWGTQFFPRLDELKDEFPGYKEELSNVLGYVDSDELLYWNDVGTIEALRDTSMRLIDGIPGVNTISRRRRDQESNTITGKLEHSLMGQGCKVLGDIEDCVLGNDVYVGAGTHLKGCVLNTQALVGKNQTGEGWMLDRLAEVQEGAQVGKNVVAGRQSTILSGAKVKDGTKIGAGTNIDKEASGEVRI